MKNVQQVCPHCDFALDAHFNYCGQCASALKQVCLRCHQQSPVSFRYCGHCAEPLSTASRKKASEAIPEPVQDAQTHSPTFLEKPTLDRGAAARMQERRQVVILFCDLCGFTKLSETLDPEEVSNIIHPLFAQLSQIIHDYQGSIEKFIGDAIMAIFGVPIAHEDDAERALMVALAMQRTIREYSEKIEHDISMRIGLNVGTVVSGQVLYGGDKPDYTVIGDAINTAARVEQHTPKGSILVTAGLYQLTQDRFVYRDHAPIIAKGKSEPIETFELLGVQNLRQASRGSLEIPVVGREHEQERLRHCGEKLVKHQSVAIGLSGAAGIGKSRLFYELQRELEHHLPLRSYRAYAVSYTQHASLSLLRQILRQLLQVSENDQIATVEQVLQGHLRLLPGFGELQRALLLQLLFPDREHAVLQHQSADLLQKQWYKVLAEFVLKMSQAQPLLLVLEDLQWADEASLDWLDYFLKQMQGSTGATLMLGATWRSVGEERLNFAWDEAHTLAPLTAMACEQLFLHHLQLEALPSSLSPLAQRIIERSQGNPYYLEESLRILKETGALVFAEGVWVLTTALDDLPLPNSLQRLILSQIDRLPNALREVLQVAAVVGQTFEQRLLEGLDLWSSEALAQMIQSCLAQGYWRVLAPGVLMFNNAIVRETVYQTLLLKRRGQLHQRIGDYIEASDQWQSDTFDRLAHHFIRAKDRLKAIRYLYIAARQSDRFFAHQAALASYAQALLLLQSGEAGKPDTLIAVNPAGNEWLSLAQLEAQVRLAIIDVYWLVGDYTLALEHIITALGYSQERFFQARLYLKQGKCFEKLSRWEEALKAFQAGEAQLEQSHYVLEMAQLKSAESWTHYRQGDYTQAQVACDEALAILESVPDMQALAYAHNVKGVIFYHRSAWDQALASYRQSLAIQEKIHDLWGQGNSWSNLGSVYLMTSRLADAEQAFITSLQLRESLGDLNGVATSCNNLGHIYQELKQPEKAVVSLQRSLDIYTRSGNQLGRVISLCNLGTAYYLGERPEEAEAQLREGIAGLRSLEVTQILPEALNGLAEVLLSQERCKEAQAVLEEVYTLLDQDPMQTARYYRLQGWFEALNQQFSQAKTAWQNALTHLKPEDTQEKTRLYLVLAQWADRVKLQTSSHWQHELDTLQPKLQG